jgi:predicted HicB family RNase H-like nuclease
MSSNHLAYKDYVGSAELSAEDQCFHGKILFIDDIVTYEGESYKELKTAFEEAVDRYLAYCEKSGKPASKPYSGSFNVRIGPELHRQAVKAAYLKSMTLNQFVVNAIESAIEQNGALKVEHHHEHIVKINVEAGTAAPSYQTLTAIGGQSAKVH